MIKRDIGGIRGFLDLSIFVENVGGLLDMLSSSPLKKEINTEKINKKGSRPKALSLELSPFFEGEKKMGD